MDPVLVLKASAALAVMGVVVGLMLAVAARRFHVEVDERVESVFGALPGSNCGACGNPSCFSAAEAIAAGSKPVSACVAGGQSVADAVAGALGVEAEAVSALVACRHCGGGRDAERLFDYSGLLSCASAAKLAGGDLVCAWGCLGYGDCVRACPFDAIAMDARGLPVIDLAVCTGCGICVSECPRSATGLMEMLAEGAAIAVRCCAHDKPAARKRACPHACIACKKCEKACPEDAIRVVDLMAVVDYERCTGCGACVVVCPQDCIDLHGRGAVAPAHALDGRAANVAGFVPPEVATEAGEDE